MVGIGGAGMRNLARLFLARGIGVSGSDLKDSDGLVELAALGARVRVGHAADVGDPDAVVISSAITEENPELAAARGRGSPCGRANRRSPHSPRPIGRSRWREPPGRRRRRP